MMLNISVDIKPTENKDVLIEIIKKIFPDSELKIKKESIEGTADFELFKELCEKQKAVVVLNRLEENGSVELNKLAATNGKVGLNEDFPLGCIKIILKQ